MEFEEILGHQKRLIGYKINVSYLLLEKTELKN